MAGQGSRHYQQLSSIDQIQRTVSFRAVEGCLAVLMGVGENEPWRTTTNTAMPISWLPLVSLLICTAGFVMYQMVLRLKKSKRKPSRPTA
jgi:hypothetical protein